MPDASPPSLESPVTSLRGVGPERALLLARLDIRTVADLLGHRPRRYEDRRAIRTIASLEPEVPGIAHGRIVAQGVKWWRQRQKCVFEFVLEDGTGRLHCRWWNLPYLDEHFHVGDEVFVFGKLRSLKPRTIDHPETEVIEGGEELSVHLHRVVPIYPLVDGLAQRWLRGLVWRTLDHVVPTLAEPEPGPELGDLPARAVAVRNLHFPEHPGDEERARRRLAFDELLEFQRVIQERRRRLQEQARGLRCGGDNRLIRPFVANLPFTLTDAQSGVLRDIRRDLAGPHPMRRLLQGDVGSGKTVVAACAALMALQSGWDVALMAPTEILAEQHARTFSDWFGPLGLRVELRTGSRKAALPAAGSPAGGTSEADPAHGTGAVPDGTLTVGTHALIEAGFAPERLGLVIIDEQHKFGVTQRERLVRKGHYPHLLVLTATPIPRTLGLTLYGDLDVSVIDQGPAGRGRVRTFVRGTESLPKVWTFVQQKLGEGRQAYVVYPRVEESDPQTGMKAVLEECERLAARFAPRRVGLLHGRLSAEEKDRVMAAFRANETAVLVATSVIEVGLDVPNATVMVVENAESYGLAQLHQLRGRIGRGRADAYCILIAAARTEEARERLRVLEETTDGFRIAETDLQLRGPGEFLGQTQSGLPPFQFADLARDLDLVERARAAAKRLAALEPVRGPSGVSFRIAAAKAG